MPTVLVTGGAGYVGSHACKALHRSGLGPVTLDNLSTGHRQAVKWGPLEAGDVRDENFVVDVMTRHGANAILHFAARSLIGESRTKPLEYYDNNVAGALALVAAMIRCGIERIVFSSTCAIYGMPDKLPIEETAAARPINIYGRTKLAVEDFLTDMAETGTIRTVLLRYFNAADGDGEIGESHDPETHSGASCHPGRAAARPAAAHLRARLSDGRWHLRARRRARRGSGRGSPAGAPPSWMQTAAAGPSISAPDVPSPCAKSLLRSNVRSAYACRPSWHPGGPAIRLGCLPPLGARSGNSAGFPPEATSRASLNPPPVGTVAIFS